MCSARVVKYPGVFLTVASVYYEVIALISMVARATPAILSRFLKIGFLGAISVFLSPHDVLLSLVCRLKETEVFHENKIKISGYRFTRRRSS